jgi:hypothetical protein
MSDPHPRLVLEDPADVEYTARAIAGGAIVGHPFGNIYVLTARPDPDSARRLNRLTGSPAEQPGSLVTTRPHVPALFDWSSLPAGLSRPTIVRLIDQLLGLGPCGFRGPAAETLPDHLVAWVDDVRTARLEAPGYRCGSNILLGRAMQLLDVEYLCVTAVEDEPAHLTAASLVDRFGQEPTGLALIVSHTDAAASAAYPKHAPTAPTVLAFHSLGTPAADGTPRLPVERQGSLADDTLRESLDAVGLGLDSKPTLLPIAKHPYLSAEV